MKKICYMALILLGMQASAQPLKGDVFLNSSFGHYTESLNDLDRGNAFINPNIGYYFSDVFAISIGYLYRKYEEENEYYFTGNRQVLKTEERSSIFGFGFSIQPEVGKKLRSTFSFSSGLGNEVISLEQEELKIGILQFGFDVGFIYFPVRRLGFFTQIGGFSIETGKEKEVVSSGSRDLLRDKFDYERIDFGFNPQNLGFGIQFILSKPKEIPEDM